MSGADSPGVNGSTSWRVHVRYREALPEGFDCESLLAAWRLVSEFEAEESVSQVYLFGDGVQLYHSYRNGATGVIEPTFSDYPERVRARLDEARQRLATQPRARLSGLAD